MTPWLYLGYELTSPPPNIYGFVYIITNRINLKRYIGRKYFYSVKRIPPLKGKKRKRLIKGESDWKSYYGSSDNLLDDILEYGYDSFDREILSLHQTKGETNQQEVELQFKFNVLNARNEYGERRYYNQNIMGRYFAKPDTGFKETRDKTTKSYNAYYSNKPKPIELLEQSRIHQLTNLPEQINLTPIELDKSWLSSYHHKSTLDLTPKINYIYITNGIHEQQISVIEPIPDNWYQGRLDSSAYMPRKCRAIEDDNIIREFGSAKDCIEFYKMNHNAFYKIVNKDILYMKRRIKNKHIISIEYIDK